MNQLENRQARYRSNTWMGRTRTDGPDEFEQSKFNCTLLILIIECDTLSALFWRNVLLWTAIVHAFGLLNIKINYHVSR